MSAPHLPTLTRALLGGLSGRTPADADLPPAAILSAPETILQIGSGSFLRGFVEDFLQLANGAGDLAGRVVSVQRKPDRRSEAFVRQDGLYTLIQRSNENGRLTENKRIIASISRSLAAETQWNQIVDMAVRSATRVIVSNVTEAGFVLTTSDAPTDKPPRSFPGKLTQLLWERWRAAGTGDAEIAVIPCELIENNGARVSQLVAEQAHAWGLPPAFLAWLATSVHFANTLVDRIVVGPPIPERLEAEWLALGYRDDLIVCAEPFALFALEADEFVRKHFPIDRASPDVSFVDDLTPYRTRKVRILNGPHTILAALGRLLGFSTVREAIEDPQLGGFIENAIFQEIIPGFAPDQEAQNAQYARATLARFGNPSVEHQLIAICLNCGTKVGVRLFPSIRDCMARRKVIPQRLLFGLAAVILLLREPDVQDTHAEQVREIWGRVDPRSADSVLALVQEVLAKQVDWSREKMDLDAVAPRVASFLMEICQRGLRTAMESCFDGSAPLTRSRTCCS